MRYRLLVTIVLSAFFTCTGNVAEAQFLKKLFGGRKSRAENTDKVKQPKPVLKPVKKREYSYPLTTIKDRYRIDVFVPLYLNELVDDEKPVYKGRLPEKAQQGTDFCSGLRLAADSLNKTGHQLDVYIHDVTDSFETPSVLIKSGVLNETDLVVGVLQAQQIGELATWAKSRNINFVSAMSGADGGITENPFFTTLQPTLRAHCEWIMDRVSKKQFPAKPLVLYRSAPIADVSAFTSLNVTENNSNRLLCNSIPTRQAIAKYIDSSKTNIIIVPILDIAYSEKLLQALNNYFPGFRFEIYGMPSWRSMGLLKRVGILANSTINVPYPYYFDPYSNAAQPVNNACKREMGISRPSDMVYRGYETMFYYGYLLSRYGTIFNDKVNDKAAYSLTTFDIGLSWDKEDKLLYEENRHLYLYKYSDGNMQVQ